MYRRASLFTLMSLLLCVGLSSAQEYPLMKAIANKVI